MTAVFGLGPLERWLGDPEVTEVLVNGGRELWVERRPSSGGTLGRGPQFVGLVEPAVVDAVVERILAPIGRRLDRTTPIVDARLPDGSRVSAIVPPVAVDGTCLAVRRFHGTSVSLLDFAPAAVASLLGELVGQRCNVVVSGPTSAGKTTLLDALTGHIDPAERIVTLEDTAELQLRVPHVLRLETRPANADGLRAVTLTDLVRAALRLRPDRLVVGEIRGDEAVDLVQALNTGHDGSLATIHANSCADALARLASLVVRAAPAWSLPAVRDQVHRSIHAVVQVARDPDGRRRVVEVVEVGLDRDGLPTTRPLAHDGRVVGAPTPRRAGQEAR